MSIASGPMDVEYFGFIPGTGYGNILWATSRPMRAGKFPALHPCHLNPRPTVFGRGEQPKTTDPLGLFRARGYMASCFPEGDGIAFEPPAGRAHEQIIADIVECFGFRVTVRRR